jgi:outer membrane lipoprotein SlyB
MLNHDLTRSYAWVTGRLPAVKETISKPPESSSRGYQMRRIIFALAMVCVLAGSAAADHKMIPSGSEIRVRTNETIDSNSARAGQTFSAQIESDVTNSEGAVLIPKGSPADLVIRDMSTSNSGNIKDLVLDLQAVNVNGVRYRVSTQDIERSRREGLGKNKRTATMTGGGAAVGAIIGAIAGGGKGAAIGAITGAGAGAAAQVLTRGKQVKVPAESVLTFKLDESLNLQSQ